MYRAIYSGIEIALKLHFMEFEFVHDRICIVHDSFLFFFCETDRHTQFIQQQKWYEPFYLCILLSETVTIPITSNGVTETEQAKKATQKNRLYACNQFQNWNWNARLKIGCWWQQQQQQNEIEKSRRLQSIMHSDRVLAGNSFYTALENKYKVYVLHSALHTVSQFHKNVLARTA